MLELHFCLLDQASLPVTTEMFVMYNRGTRRLALKIRIPLRFGARSLLLLTMVVAAYLTWRLQNQETRAKRVIESLGGYAFCVGKVQMTNGFKVYSIRTGPYSGTTVRLSDESPSFSFSELALGPSEEHNIETVVLRLDKLTPQVTAILSDLESLRDVVLIVDGPVDSGTVWRAAELRLPSNIRVNFTNKFEILKP